MAAAFVLFSACSDDTVRPVVADCGPGAATEDGGCAGGDAGPLDAAVAQDAAAPVDAGMTLDDAGVLPDAGAPEPPADGRCRDDLAFGAPSEPVGRFEVGDFVVQLGQDGELSAIHANDVAQTVFQSAPGRWLELGQHELHAEEHQGSFDIAANPLFSCARHRINELRTARGALEFSGDFEDLDSRCVGMRFTLRVCQAGPGRLAFSVAPQSNQTVNFSRLRVRSRADERIYGMGEQFPHDTLNLKGREIPVLSQEGGVGRGHPIIARAVNVASPGSAGSEDSTYYAAPHYLTSDLRSLFLHNSAYGLFDFRRDERIEISLYDGAMTWEALYGETPLELIERFTDYAGRMPPPPAWTQRGAIVALARPLAESATIVDDLIDAGARIAGVWNQTWSGINETFIGEQVLWNWTLDEREHPGWHGWVDGHAERNIKTLCYINSMFLDVSDRDPQPSRHLYAEGAAGGYFVRDQDGEILQFPVTAFDVALLDFSNEAARSWMKGIIIDELVRGAGCSGWMVDFAEALPFDAVLADGSSAAAYHNRYPVEWMRLNREAIEEAGLLGELLTFNRAGASRSPAHSLMFWEGDQLTTWDKYDGFISAIHGLLNGGFSGLALNHSDTGGYTSLSRFGLGYSREAELLKRWGEMSAFTSLLRTHEGNQPGANAQIYDADQRAQFAWATRVFAGLADYRAARFAEASERGWPVVRHLWLHHPDDAEAHDVHDQFLLGEGILVAPIVQKCGLRPFCRHRRSVYLPAGSWRHLWSGERHQGPTRIDVDAPFQQPPVFYRSDDGEAVEAVERLRGFDVGVHPAD